MCLNNLEDFTPARVGYQVKHKSGSTYSSLFFHADADGELGIEYTAKPAKVWAKSRPKHLGSVHILSGSHGISKAIRDHCYIAGFHVFHKLEDARAYRKEYMYDDKGYAIVKVKCAGKKRTGIQRFMHWGRGTKDTRQISAHVTVCEQITILKEVS